MRKNQLLPVLLLPMIIEHKKNGCSSATVSHADFSNNNDCDDDHDWSASSSLYPNMEEFASFITRHRQSAPDHIFTTTADPSNLQGKQLATYNLIKDHIE